MTFGSLFSGIGGMDLGLERAGMVCKWQVEIDPFCSKVLAKHWPGVKRYGDIRELSGTGLERVDLIAGGFPCQDISDAGNKLGTAGERSGLYREVLRLVDEIRPSLLLMENVAALLKRGMGSVLGDLAEMGLDAEWCCLPASRFGASHERDRVFILAYAPSIGLSSGDKRLPLLAEPKFKSRDFQGRVDTSRTFRIADGLPDWMDRLKSCGNAVVPQVAEWIGKRILEAAGQRTDVS